MAAPLALLTRTAVHTQAAQAVRLVTLAAARGWLRVVCAATGCRRDAEAAAVQLEGLHRQLLQEALAEQQLWTAHQTDRLHQATELGQLGQLAIAVAACLAEHRAARVSARLAVQVWYWSMHWQFIVPEQRAKFKSIDSQCLLQHWQVQRREMKMKLSEAARALQSYRSIIISKMRRSGVLVASRALSRMVQCRPRDWLQHVQLRMTQSQLLLATSQQVQLEACLSAAEQLHNEQLQQVRFELAASEVCCLDCCYWLASDCCGI